MRIVGLASVSTILLLAMHVGIAGADAMTPAAPVSAANPQPPAPIVGHADAGHHLYTALCAYCHRLDDAVSEAGAPGLKGAVSRYGEAWIDHWLADPQGFAGSDAKAKALVDARPPVPAMPALPAMQDAQNRADIIAFLKSLSDKDADAQAAQ